MKKIIYSLLLVVAAAFTSCHEVTTEDNSRLTYYASIELDEGSTVIWTLGVPFEEPGYTVTLNGEDITDDANYVTVSGTESVDVDTPGLYYITYAAINDDGFSVSTTRTILVADTTPSVIESGIWTVTSDTYRTYGGATTKFSGYTVVVLQTAPGVFYVSDLMGGYYDQGAAYGSDYAMVGEIELDADDTTIIINSGDVAGWGDSMDSYANAKYDAEKETLYWEVGYVGDTMVFYVTLEL